jgi:DNA-directed RNA polymerase alpha subunit
MSVERDIVEELDVVLASIRNAEKNIIGKDSSDKLEIVKRLVDIEETVKAIRNDISIPALKVTENTLIEELEREKMLSVRSGNILRRSGCKTIGDITNHTVREITIMRNMGKKAADEIIRFLTANGFSLKGENE